MKGSKQKSLFSVFIISGIVLFLFLIVSSLYTINEGERGVVLRYGKTVKIAEPGLGIKIPLVDNVEKISVRNQAVIFKSLQAYSNDQQPAVMTVSVNFHIPPTEVEKMYSGYQTINALKDRLLTRQIPTQLENVFGQYTAIKAVQDRAKLVQDIQNAVKNAISGPIIIESVQIETIDFSDAYEQSIEDRMKAEVAIATRRQNLETEKIQAQIKVTQAQAEADSQLAAAKAEAESIRLRGSAEAEAIRARGNALRENPELVSLITAERWNGQLPQTMIPGNGVPFINTK